MFGSCVRGCSGQTRTDTAHSRFSVGHGRHHSWWRNRAHWATWVKPFLNYIRSPNFGTRLASWPLQMNRQSIQRCPGVPKGLAAGRSTDSLTMSRCTAFKCESRGLIFLYQNGWTYSHVLSGFDCYLLRSQRSLSMKDELLSTGAYC